MNITQWFKSDLSNFSSDDLFWHFFWKRIVVSIVTLSVLIAIYNTFDNSVNQNAENVIKLELLKTIQGTKAYKDGNISVEDITNALNSTKDNFYKFRLAEQKQEDEATVVEKLQSQTYKDETNADIYIKTYQATRGK